MRRESTDVIDMLLSHVGAMDCFAKALRIAAKIKQDGIMDKMRKVRSYYDVLSTSLICNQYQLDIYVILLIV